MDHQIEDFINFLEDNTIIFKFYEPETITPDDPRCDNWVFNEDFLIEEMKFSDDELDELTDFIFTELSNYHYGKAREGLLNDYSQPIHLEDYLEKEFEKFRIALTKDFKRIRESELREMIQQAKYARYELEMINSANRDNKWMIFDSLLLAKKDFCVETIRFLRMSLAGLPKDEADANEYYFSIMPQYTTQRHNILSVIHKDLKAEGYIDCTFNEFKDVFTSKDPKPIKWYKPLRHLTFMIDKMTGLFLVEKIKPSNYYIAEKYFNIYKNGILFPPKRLRHDDDPKSADSIFLKNVIDNAITTFK
ncbi:MAG: hypothetical protein KAR19_19940 [Bacteroidales bacterium]|nr:hypothetical protein [Bacteroidales bacterium]